MEPPPAIPTGWPRTGGIVVTVQLFGKRNDAVFDEWSTAHVAAGLLAEKMQLSLFTAIILHTVFEVIENNEPVRGWLHLKFGREPYHGDSIQNFLGDTLSFVAGYMLAERAR
jgi:hypothetical protein